MTSKTTERVAAAATDELAPGEQVHAAFAVTVRRGGHLERWAGEVDRAATLPEYTARHGDADPLRSADRDFPSGIIVAVTDRRLLVLGRRSFGRPGELLSAVELLSTTLDVIERGERARSWLLLFSLPDGTVLAGEAGVNGAAAAEAAAFVEAYRSASAAITS